MAPPHCLCCRSSATTISLLAVQVHEATLATPGVCNIRTRRAVTDVDTLPAMSNSSPRLLVPHTKMPSCHAPLHKHVCCWLCCTGCTAVLVTSELHRLC
jgi:hypothetical protein